MCVKLALYMCICMCELNVWGERMFILARVWRATPSMHNIIFLRVFSYLLSTLKRTQIDHRHLYTIYNPISSLFLVHLPAIYIYFLYKTSCKLEQHIYISTYFLTPRMNLNKYVLHHL